VQTTDSKIIIADICRRRRSDNDEPVKTELLVDWMVRTMDSPAAERISRVN
jgi:hypothetical protein